MSDATSSYPRAVNSFSWDIPDFYNIGVDVCDKWAASEPGRIALIQEHDDGRVESVTFAKLRDLSNRAANALRTHGVAVGDRVAVLLPQSIPTAVAHIAIYKAGAIAVPLFALFGPEALEFRLRDSGACLLVTDKDGALKVESIRSLLPDLKTILVADSDTDMSRETKSFEHVLAGERDSFEPVRTSAHDPALIIYTSGTTGKPKGALHAHRTLLGHLPGVEMSHGGNISQTAVFWTPADWAWIGGLLDVLLPALHHGRPVVARRFSKFTAPAAFDLMERHRVTHVFMPPTALKMLRSEAAPRTRWQLHLQSVASGGESLGSEMLGWGTDALGVSINEFYGQTECNMVVSSCRAWFPAKPGAIGKAVPGHEVQIVDEEGAVQPPGSIGQIAIRSPDPVMFLGYWNNAEATLQKYRCGFLLTGDQGKMDDAGYIEFVGRDDDVITSAGYRIGPGPIEDCLLGHGAVHMAAVVGAPDPDRTEVVKAFVVLSDGSVPSEELTRELQAHVRNRLAAHEYPREIVYVQSLPMTATGKVVRRALRNP